MRDEIFEGLKNALARGESLQAAMESFHNAGYTEAEIQEAARALQPQIPSYPLNINPEEVLKKPIIKKIIDKFPKSKSRIQPQETQPSKLNQPNSQSQKPTYPLPYSTQQTPQQRISIYQENQTNPRKVIVVIIVILLVLLFIALGLIFFFRDTIISYINSFLG